MAAIDQERTVFNVPVSEFTLLSVFSPPSFFLSNEPLRLSRAQIPKVSKLGLGPRTLGTGQPLCGGDSAACSWVSRSGVF